MTRSTSRLIVTLDAERAAMLARLDARHVVELLDGIPGAYERARLGIEQARAGEAIPLGDL